MASKKFLKDFMRARFPKVIEGENYWNEWEQRLMTGDPRIYMDSETLKIFKKIKKKHGIA